MRLLCLAARSRSPRASSPPTIEESGTWWDKYQYFAQQRSGRVCQTTAATSSGATSDVSNRVGPQSETFIAINPSRPRQLAAGSNEIFRDPWRGYFSRQSARVGAAWTSAAGADRQRHPLWSIRRWERSTRRGKLYYG